MSPHPQFSGSIHQLPGAPAQAMVTVRGEIDIATAEAFRDLLAEGISLGGRQLIINMAGLEFIDASGLGVIVGAAARLRRLGGHLEVRAPSASIYRTFEITKFTHVINIERPGAAADLTGNLSVLAALPLTQAVLDAALQMVVTMAQAVVSGADGVSLTMLREGRFGTVAASNDVVLEMDHDQYDTGEGPCLAAATEGQRFFVESLHTEGRWPAFVPRARTRGIETILSTPLVHAGVPIGALNIYSRTAGALSGHEPHLADLFAAQSSQVVASAERARSLEQLDHSLQDTLRSREVIAQAEGMIMQRDGVSAAVAYRLLVENSRATNRSLQEVAGDLLRSPRTAASC